MSLTETIRYIAKQIIESLEFLVWKIIFIGRKKTSVGLKDQKKKKILLIQLSSIGDVLMTTPAIRGLREIFPDSEIDMIVLPQTEILLLGNPNIGRTFLCITRFWRKLFYDFSGFRKSIKTIESVKKGHYDLCIDFSGTIGSVVLALLSGARFVLGPDRDIKSGLFRGKTGKFYDYSVKITEKHILRQNLQIAAVFGKVKMDEKEEIFISDEARRNGEEFLKKKELEKGKFIVMHPGAKWPPKRWPVKYFAQLAKNISEKKGLKIIFAGGKSDRSLLKEIAKEVEISDMVLTDELGLGELAFVIANARFFVGNDSGPSHMAAAVGTPLVVLFGPTLPEISSPPAKKIAILEDKISCRPCMLYYRKDRCEKGSNVCLENIEPEDVFSAIERLEE